MIHVSTDVFAAIWKMQEPGEDSEDVVLRRILGLPTPQPELIAGIKLSDIAGFFDARFEVAFPHGFEIFRIYQNREYRAHALGNMWVRTDNGVGYKSLNRLNVSIGASENAWDAWFFVDVATGDRRPINALRDPAKVRQRLGSISEQSAEELGL